jgi:putative chitinase
MAKDVERPYGKADRSTGQVYYGRGFVQLTWERNYETMSDLLGIDFVHHPDLALELDNATKILSIGMVRGLFTGKSLSDYFCKTKEDWVSARKIINGLDKAQAIALYGHNFYSAISYTIGRDFFRSAAAHGITGSAADGIAGAPPAEIARRRSDAAI